MLIVYQLVTFFPYVNCPNSFINDNSYLPPNPRIACWTSSNSYKILNPKAVEPIEDGRKAADIIITSVNLDTASYRLGVTKAWSKLLSLFPRSSRVVAVMVVVFFFWWWCFSDQRWQIRCTAAFMMRSRGSWTVDISLAADPRGIRTWPSLPGTGSNRFLGTPFR